MATIIGEAAPPADSPSSGGDAGGCCSKKAIVLPVAATPMVPRAKDPTMEDTNNEDVEKIKSQMDVDLAEAERLRKQIERLQGGPRAVESDLFRFCRELINMRLARGRTPLSSAEKARLEEIQKLARRGVDQYTAAKGSLPPFVNPFPKRCPPMV